MYTLCVRVMYTYTLYIQIFMFPDVVAYAHILCTYLVYTLHLHTHYMYLETVNVIAKTDLACLSQHCLIRDQLFGSCDT